MSRLLASSATPSRSQSRLCVIVLLALVCLGAASCAPSQEQLDAHATVVAASVYATQTAAVAAPTFNFWGTTGTPVSTLTPTPTRTSSPTRADTATPAPTSTDTPTPTATAVPEPDAVVVAEGVNLREGPGSDFAILGHLSQSEELDVTGRFGDCDWLWVESPSQSLVGWVTGSAQYVDLRVDCGDLAPGIYRPMTGVIKENQSGGGYGEFEVQNGTASDGLVVLMLDDAPVTAAYVRSQDSITLKGIRDGTYYLFFSTGDKWNGEQFTLAPSYRKFEDTFDFTTGPTTYSVWSVTLHGVAGGTASAEDVPADQFPGLGD